MSINSKKGFPATRHPIEGVPAMPWRGGLSGTVPPGFAINSYYYAITATSTQPALLIANWTLTTKMDDVGANDHTTYESVVDAGATGRYIHVLKYLSAAADKTLQAYTISLAWLGAGDYSVAYYTGAAYAAWDAGAAVADNNGVLTWVDHTRNPADQINAQAVVVTAQDIVGLGGSSCEMRIGDFRITHT